MPTNMIFITIILKSRYAINHVTTEFVRGRTSEKYFKRYRRICSNTRRWEKFSKAEITCDILYITHLKYCSWKSDSCLVFGKQILDEAATASRVKAPGVWVLAVGHPVTDAASAHINKYNCASSHQHTFQTAHNPRSTMQFPLREKYFGSSILEFCSREMLFSSTKTKIPFQYFKSDQSYYFKSYVRIY